jgi:hypothetical protein
MKLIECVTKCAGKGLGGGIDWKVVAADMGEDRTSVQCRRRWNAHLRDANSDRIRTTPWTSEEVITIYSIIININYFYFIILIILL